MSDTLFEFYDTGIDNTVDINGDTWLAQIFTPDTEHAITSIKLRLFRYDIAGYTGTTTVSIRATSAGEPTGGDLTSGTVLDSTLQVVDSLEEVVVTPFTLSASTPYAIIVRSDTGSGNKIRIRRDINSSTYAGGTQVSSVNAGSTWTISPAFDLAFYEYGIEATEKTFTSDVSISQDNIAKTFVAQANLTARNTKTFTVDVYPARLKSFSAQVSIAQDSILKTLAADVSIMDTFTKTFTTDASIGEQTDNSVPFPRSRPAAYDEDKVWNEETGSWVTPAVLDSAGGDRYQKRVIIVSDQGVIYYGDL